MLDLMYYFETFPAVTEDPLLRDAIHPLGTESIET